MDNEDKENFTKMVMNALTMDDYDINIVEKQIAKSEKFDVSFCRDFSNSHQQMVNSVRDHSAKEREVFVSPSVYFLLNQMKVMDSDHMIGDTKIMLYLTNGMDMIYYPTQKVYLSITE